MRLLTRIWLQARAAIWESELRDAERACRRARKRLRWAEEWEFEASTGLSRTIARLEDLER